MATMTGRFTLKRTEPEMLEGRFESLYDRNVGPDPDRARMGALLVEAWRHAPAPERLRPEIADLYRAEEAVLGANNWSESSPALWVHVMGGGFGDPGQPVTGLAIGVDEPALFDFVAVGEAFSWESYVFG